MASKPTCSFEKLLGIPPKGSRVDLDLVELWIYYEAMRVEEAVLVDGVVEEADGGLVEANHQLVGEHPKLVHTGAEVQSSAQGLNETAIWALYCINTCLLR